jgi:hypothetical protein
MRPGGKGHRGYTLSALQIAWDRLRVGQTDPDATSINPVSLENPANPERESARRQPDNAGLTEFSGCTGLQETGAGSALRAKLLPYFTAPGEQTPATNGHAPHLPGDHNGDTATPNGNGERRAPVPDTNTVPPGGLTNLTPGLTDRVQRALTSARAATASTVTNGQVMTAVAAPAGSAPMATP